MTSHQLARILLSEPDLPVATHADNNTAHRDEIRVGILHQNDGDRIVIGNMSKKNLNRPNWYITRMITGDLPEEWPKWEKGKGKWIF